MATTLLLVQTDTAPGTEAKFDEWYNNEHCPGMLRVPGIVSASRYHRLLASGPYRFLAAYEFESPLAIVRFRDSDYRVELRADHDRRFPQPVPPSGSTWEQVWP